MDNTELPPQKAGQAQTMLICEGQSTVPAECGHWFSPAAVAGLVAVERKACANCVPENWLDPLLSGPSAVVGNLGAHNVEAILKAVKARIIGRFNVKCGMQRL